MADIFLKLFNMSITASWIVLAVVILRLFLKKAPRWINCLLWGIVALRLIIPFSLESAFSLVPSAQTIPQDIAVSQTPAINSGIPAVNNMINPIITESFAPESGANPLQTLLFTASVVWIAGMAVMLLYSIFSYARLRRQVRVSLLHREGVYACDNIESPFILGILLPKIYVPSGIDEAHLQYVLAHEKAHLNRRDHWWKPIGYGLLTIYWFNPLMWLAYTLLCRDIEQACDEKVIKDMDAAAKKGYSQALVSCSVRHRMIMTCPVAFGEIGVKERIKAVLSYKKPAFWIVFVSAIVCAVLSVCFLTNPKPCVHEYQAEITLQASCTQEGIKTYTCTLCPDRYTESIPIMAHSYGEAVLLQEPTCSQTGIETSTCSQCGAVKKKAVQTLAHTFGTPTLTKEPNCTEKGERSATCTVCLEVYVVETLETNDVHDMKNTVLRAATCSDPGEGVNTCTRCDYSESCTYEMLEHTYKKGFTLLATCRSEGQQEYLCSACGAKKYETLPKTDDHQWMSMGAYFPEQCSLCGTTKPDSEPEIKQAYSLLDGVTNTSRSDGTLPTIPEIRIWP